MTLMKRERRSRDEAPPASASFQAYREIHDLLWSRYSSGKCWRDFIVVRSPGGAHTEELKLRICHDPRRDGARIVIRAKTVTTVLMI